MKFGNKIAIHNHAQHFLNRTLIENCLEMDYFSICSLHCDWRLNPGGAVDKWNAGRERSSNIFVPPYGGATGEALRGLTANIDVEHSAIYALGTGTSASSKRPAKTVAA